MSAAEVEVVPCHHSVEDGWHVDVLVGSDWCEVVPCGDPTHEHKETP